MKAEGVAFGGCALLRPCQQDGLVAEVDRTEKKSDLTWEDRNFMSEFSFDFVN